MNIKVGDEVRIHKGCKRYKTYMPKILKYKGIVVDINENYENPIIVSIEGVHNNYSKKGYFYFDEGDLIYCGFEMHIFDNFDVINFNKLLKKITDKYGLIGSYSWSDDLHGYLYDFYKPGMYTNVALLDVASLHPHDVYTDKNKVATILVKPNQIDKIYETLSNIDTHLAERLYKKTFKTHKLGHWSSDQEEKQYTKDFLKIAINSTYGLQNHYNFDIKALETFAIKEKESNMLKCKIKKVIFNNPATIVFWTDGSKTVVKASNEEFDPEKGLAMAIAKKALGNEGNYFNEIKKWLPEEEDVVEINGASEFLRSLLRNAKHINDVDCQSTPAEETLPLMESDISDCRHYEPENEE